MNEEALIASIRRRLAQDTRLLSGLLVGPGDDAAVFQPFADSLVVTTDLLSDEVDFIVGEVEPEKIGRKAAGVNLSDLAAMGAVPLGVVVSVLLPRHWNGDKGNTPTGTPVPDHFASRLVEGMLPLLRRYKTSLAGGDTNSWDGKLAISVTAFGTVDPKKPLLRTGAVPGDKILVTGPLGGSIHRRQFTFEPRVAESLFLRTYRTIHAGMDISDGLLLDLSRMAKASRTGFCLDESKIPIHPDTAAFRTAADPKTPVQHALEDGEDFELILAVPPDEAARLLAEQPFQYAVHQNKTPQNKTSVSKENKASRHPPLPLPSAETVRDPKPAENENFDNFYARLGFELPVPENRAVLTEIGEFLPEESGFLRRLPDGRTVPFQKISGWEHSFE